MNETETTETDRMYFIWERKLALCIQEFIFDSLPPDREFIFSVILLSTISTIFFSRSQQFLVR